LFGDGKPHWDKILPNDVAKKLKNEFSFIAQNVTKTDINYDNTSSLSLVSRQTSIDGHLSTEIVAADSFFLSPTNIHLKNSGWSDLHCASIAMAHELVHCASHWAPGRLPPVPTPPSVQQWNQSFTSHPLFKPIQPIPLHFPENFSVLLAASPYGNFSYDLSLLKNADSLLWMKNLEELRADAIAIAFCLFSPNKIFLDHPFRASFNAATTALSTARSVSGDSYFWGEMLPLSSLLRDFKTKADAQNAPPERALRLAVHLADHLALAAANANVLTLLSKSPDARPILSGINAMFYGAEQAKQKAAQETGAARIKIQHWLNALSFSVDPNPPNAQKPSRGRR
jgi:hypothetical protein